jgi:hypothetical protein
MDSNVYLRVCIHTSDDEDVTVTDFLDDRRKEIIERLSELKPLIDEYHRLEAAVAAMRSIPVAPKGTSAGSPRLTRGRRGPGRPRGSATRASKATPATGVTQAAGATPAAGTTPAATPVLTPSATPPSVTPVTAARKKPGRPKGKVGRRKGSGKRAAEALSFVRGQPGITIGELAAKMGIKQNYLYRVLPGLEQDGKLEKQGRGWHPKGA